MNFSRFIRLAWIGSKDPEGTINDTVVAEHVAGLRELSGVGRVAAYGLVPQDKLHQQLRKNLHLTAGDVQLPKPQLLLMTEFGSHLNAVDAEDQIRALPLEHGLAASLVVGRQLLVEITSVDGMQASHFPDFAPAVQLGLYNMDSPESEQHLSWWYHRRRFAPFKEFAGGVRARWFVTVWGPTKYCIVYEFVTRAAHSQFIADIEALAHDNSHTTGSLIPHTVHDPVLSQSVGVNLRTA